MNYLATPTDPETQATKALLEASMRPVGTPGHLPLDDARTAIWGLARLLNTRVERERLT